MPRLLSSRRKPMCSIAGHQWKPRASIWPYTRITAPISGRIGRSSVTEGAIVTAYQPLALATIQQLDPIYVDVPQSTTELLRLKRRLADGRLNKDAENHNTATLFMEDGSAYPREGTLQFQDVTVDPTTGSVTLRAVFPNPDNALLPGMFVQTVIKEGVNPAAILVPQQGVSRDRRGNPQGTDCRCRKQDGPAHAYRGPGRRGPMAGCGWPGPRRPG